MGSQRDTTERLIPSLWNQYKSVNTLWEGVTLAVNTQRIWWASWELPTPDLPSPSTDWLGEGL